MASQNPYIAPHEMRRRSRGFQIEGRASGCYAAFELERQSRHRIRNPGTPLRQEPNTTTNNFVANVHLAHFA
ncbi:hypothetical protein TWF694_000229 [Orbilia ellipsospora]|uniref:Uncharacterized protein n=1 Tax=Orbilia ellipsospora TaxID=2528407 RepID=A0AAV9XUN5_9PEZI